MHPAWGRPAPAGAPCTHSGMGVPRARLRGGADVSGSAWGRCRGEVRRDASRCRPETGRLARLGSHVCSTHDLIPPVRIDCPVPAGGARSIRASLVSTSRRTSSQPNALERSFGPPWVCCGGLRLATALEAPCAPPAVRTGAVAWRRFLNRYFAYQLPQDVYHHPSARCKEKSADCMMRILIVIVPNYPGHVSAPWRLLSRCRIIVTNPR